MDGGIEIFLEKLNTVKIAKNGKTAEIGGGTVSKVVTDTLWAKGKQAGKLKISRTCTCTIYHL